MERTLYHYKAIVTSVYDGDTFTVDIDFGLSAWIRGEKLRLNRINAPELRGDERAKGLLSLDFLKGKIEGKEITIETIKDRRDLKYGRYLAEIWLEEKKSKFVKINDLMVKEGFAKYQKY
jgi:micrococcal nuclease